ncbi:MAG: hypothetical protein IH629_07775 [Thermoleophilia bacterium]|nr:hypothetical protein [Thermoleophilia bacterium]
MRNALILLAVVALLILVGGALNNGVVFDVDYVAGTATGVSLLWVATVIAALVFVVGLIAAYLARTAVFDQRRKLEAQLQTTYERLREAESLAARLAPVPAPEEATVVAPAEEAATVVDTDEAETVVDTAEVAMVAAVVQEATVVVDDGDVTVVAADADTVIVGPDLGEAEPETTDDVGAQDAGEAGETTAVTMSGGITGEGDVQSPPEAAEDDGRGGGNGSRSG